MRVIFYIDGGAGRIISAIPALLKFARLNPETDWSVIITGWESLYWGIPELQDRTYGIDTKGLFDNIVKNSDIIITPEPYRVPQYFRQEISLSEAFDREINQTMDHSDLTPPRLYFNIAEQKIATNTLNDVKNAYKHDKTIIIQPFGRGSRIDNTDIIDEESRSMNVHTYLKLVKKLSRKYNVIFFGEPEFQLKSDTYTAKFTCDLRQWAAIISQADYFIGCDSVGQHIARAVDTHGTVIFGSTFPLNTSYPDFFQIIENSAQKKYSPIRIAGLDSILANRLNEGLMNFSNKEINQIYAAIITDIENKT